MAYGGIIKQVDDSSDLMGSVLLERRNINVNKISYYDAKND